MTSLVSLPMSLCRSGFRAQVETMRLQRQGRLVPQPKLRRPRNHSPTQSPNSEDKTAPPETPNQPAQPSPTSTGGLAASSRLIFAALEHSNKSDKAWGTFSTMRTSAYRQPKRSEHPTQQLMMYCYHITRISTLMPSR